MNVLVDLQAKEFMTAMAENENVKKWRTAKSHPLALKNISVDNRVIYDRVLETLYNVIAKKNCYKIG